MPLATDSVLIVVGTSSSRILGVDELHELIEPYKTGGATVGVLALRFASREVPPEDYGIPIKEGVSVFRFIHTPEAGIYGSEKIPSNGKALDSLNRWLQIGALRRYVVKQTQ